MTSIIRAEAAHDFLALVPALVGYRPSRSVLCVAFTGNRTSGVLRHDLPAHRGAEEALVGSLVGTLCRLTGADAVVPIVYTHERFDGRDLPRGELLRAIVRRAEEAGFLVRDALCVAADGWASLLDEGTPAGGRPLALIERSPVAAQAEQYGPVADSHAVFVPIPEADPEIRRNIERILRDLDVASAEGPGVGGGANHPRRHQEVRGVAVAR
jgi:hypothetical protein